MLENNTKQFLDKMTRYKHRFGMDKWIKKLSEEINIPEELIKIYLNYE